MNRDGTHLDHSQSETVLPQPGIFSIANQIRYGFLLLLILFLLGTGGLLIWFSFQAQQIQLVDTQQERSRAVASEINAFLDDLQRKLSYLARVQGLTDFPSETQQRLLEGLTRHNDAYETVAILDDTGQVIASVSPFGEAISGNLADTPLFLRAFRQQEDFVGPVEIDSDLQVPVVTLAVPIRNQLDEVAGVLLARVNLKFLQFVVSQTVVGQSGYAYIIDNRNFLIAQQGGSQEVLLDLSDRTYIQQFATGILDTQESYLGLRGREVLGAFAPIRSVRWNVGVELPTAEAFAPTRNMLLAMGSGLLLAVVVAAGLGVALSRQVVTPLQRLTQASSQISRGNLDTQVNIASHNEMGILAATFNRMAAQLGNLYASQEELVASRTQRLEIIAGMSEYLNTILELDPLLIELVNQTKSNFNYYHVHVYLIDQKEEQLVVAAGTGEAGEQMLARGHHIPLDALTSLVARAARTHQIVRVDNVRKAPDWLPNELLPDTHSEMAVPIILEDQVVGVLDVQKDEVGGLDEGDESLLRSLANQVAVAIRNARLFDEAQSALTEARAVQQQYVTEAWDRERVVRRGQGRVQFSLGESSTLSEPEVTQARHTALSIRKPQLIALNDTEVNVLTEGIAVDEAASSEIMATESGDSPSENRVLVAPIILQDVAIGNLQLHEGSNPKAWTASELALINTVLDQVAQAAENLRLVEDVQERASREQLINQISTKLRRAPDLESLLQVGTSEIAKVLNPARTFVNLGESNPDSSDHPSDISERSNGNDNV